MQALKGTFMSFDIDFLYFNLKTKYFKFPFKFIASMYTVQSSDRGLRIVTKTNFKKNEVGGVGWGV